MTGQFPPLLMQLDRSGGEIEIMLDLECKKTVFLKDLIPNWWREDRFEKRQKT